MEELIAKLALKVWPGVSEERLASAIGDNKSTDEAGRRPSDVNWVPTYDLNAAAADLWEERAAELSDKFDFSADGGNFSRNQAHGNALKQASLFRSRSRIKLRTI